jgi:predicted N-acyltransferase
MSKTKSPGPGNYRTATLDGIAGVSAPDWNRLTGSSPDPATRHEFLLAMERNGCLGERFGWLPRHIVCHDADGRLVGAAPCYLKDNSYGEFVFDWSWADAYQRNGRAYYPKLVSAVPYTPVSGNRLLVHPEADRSAVVDALLAEAGRLSASEGSSSHHWLFTTQQDTADLVNRGYLRRTGCNFHWHNRDYRDFDDFLAAMTSRKRKKIRRERRYVEEAGIQMEIVKGNLADDHHWETMHRFYSKTFLQKSGMPTLSLPFFREIGETMGEQVVLVFARHGNDIVAGAFMLQGETALYGRHWGCSSEFHSLHFETCYYQGIEYCIENGLALFEPGVQGEHKISRGFVPTLTWSAHAIEDAAFRDAIARYLEHEHELILDYRDELCRRSPFRDSALLAETPE